MMTQVHEKRALSIRETVARYSIGRSTIYELIKQGKLRSVKIAGKRLVPVDAIEALISGGQNG
jgi:excisionase family DNA binding protein